MRRLKLVTMLAIVFLLPTISAFAAPYFSRGVSIKGAIAYQDSLDPAQFWFFPTTSDELLGERLTTFRVAHYGFGPAYYVQTDDGSIKNATGAVIAGTFSFDLSAAKRQELIDIIKTTFSIPNPRLLPIPLRESRVSSVVLAKFFGQFGKVEQNLPSGFQIGPEVAFAAGSGSSLFAQILANAQVGGGIQANPNFAMNIDAKAEFVGDPWTYDIDCDLSQVWKSVRQHAQASVNYGFVKIGSAEYNGIFKDLQKTNVCNFKQIEGSLDTQEYGRQIGETMKQIFQTINDKAVNGEGFFRFEPNEEAPPAGGGGGGGFGLFGWSFSINAGYSESFFSQKIVFQRHVSYTGRLEAPISFSAVMAVACGPETKGHFSDLGNTTEPCITQDKIDQFNARAKKEAAAKTAAVLDLAKRLLAGTITAEQYEKVMALYATITITDAEQAHSTAEAWQFATKNETIPLSSKLSPPRPKLADLEKQAIAGPTIPNSPSETVQILSGVEPRRNRKHR